MRYTALAVQYHDSRREWLVQRISHPGKTVEVVATANDKGQALTEAHSMGNPFGIYVETRNHRPDSFQANPEKWAEVLAKHGEIFGKPPVIVDKTMGQWVIAKPEPNPMHAGKPSLEIWNGYSKKTEAVDAAKTAVITGNFANEHYGTEGLPGALIHTADRDPQKVKIWGTHFWNKLLR